MRAYVSLGGLDAGGRRGRRCVHGRVERADELTGHPGDRARAVESYEDGRHQFAGDVTLGRTGAFGYTVRVLPHHDGLVSSAETGLVVSA